MNVCKYCGFEFDGNFCPQCGTKVDDSDSSDVVLSSYDEDKAEKESMISSVFNGDGLSLEEKEKNILEHVDRLIKFGGFIEAEQILKDLEKDEVSRLGSVTAAVYYYKILTRYRVSSDDELIRKLASLKLNLKSDIDFHMSQVCFDSEYKDRIKRIEEIVEDAAKERKKIDHDRNQVAQAEDLHRSTVRLSAWNVFFALAGLIFLLIELATSSRALNTLSFIFVLCLSFVSVVFSIYLLRARGNVSTKLKNLNAWMLALSIILLVLCIVFVAI